MSLKDRLNESVAIKALATPSAEASNLGDFALGDLAFGDLTLLGLAELVRLPVAAGTVVPGLPNDPTGVQPNDAPASATDQAEPDDFSDLSLEDLLSLSVSGEDEPDDEDVTDEGSETGSTGDGSSKEIDPGAESETENAAPDGSNGPLEELQVEAIEWLSQDDGFAGVGSGYGFYDPGVATAGRFSSLRVGSASAGPGDQPVPGALAVAQSDPVQNWITPFAIDLLGGTVAENWSMADAVGTVAALGAGTTVTYSLLDDAGGQFAIDGATGTITILSGPFDFTAQTSHTIVVEATAGDQTVQQTFTIQVSPNDLDGLGLAGDQVLTGRNGNSDDRLYGGAGNDSLDGRNGDDELYGGSGDDVLRGGNHDDSLFGGSGDDILYGDNHADRLYGGTGDDWLYGGNHDDLLVGGGGADHLFGGQDADILYGDGGDDYLDGGSGSDVLRGGADNDYLVADAADLWIDGGEGEDTLVVLAGDFDVTAFGGTLSNLERVDLLSDTGANTLTLSAADVLDMTENGLLTVLGDAGDTVRTSGDWTLVQTDGDGFRLYTLDVGFDVAGLLLGPDVQLDPQEGG